MVNVTESVSLSGGAEKGLGYFKMLHEVQERDVRFAGELFTMVSAGIVMGTPMLCGYSPTQTADLLCNLGGDKYQTMLPKNPREYIKWARGLRKTFNKDCIATAKRDFSWKRLRTSGRLAPETKPMIGISKYKDILKIAGKDLFNGLGDGHFTAPWKEIMNGSPATLMEDTGLYYFSDDGVYKWNEQSYVLDKVSSHVEPLWKVFLMGFANIRPFGKIYRLHFGEKFLGIPIKNRPFDQGILDNKGNLVSGPVYCIACTPFPTEIKSHNGLFGIDSYNYLRHPGVKERTAFPTDDAQEISFYNFSNDRVMREYVYGMSVWQDDFYFEEGEEA